jgi:hypothetical protein
VGRIRASKRYNTRHPSRRLASRYTRLRTNLDIIASGSTNKCLEEEHDDGSASVIRYVHGILSSFALVPFTQVPGWNLQRCRDVVQAARAELRTRNKDIFFKL